MAMPCVSCCIGGSTFKQSAATEHFVDHLTSFRYTHPHVHCQYKPGSTETRCTVLRPFCLPLSKLPPKHLEKCPPTETTAENELRNLTVLDGALQSEILGSKPTHTYHNTTTLAAFCMESVVIGKESNHSPWHACRLALISGFQCFERRSNRRTGTR